jgi:AcrR family transcriptional regulator
MPATQKRAIQTRENILDALESLLADKEFEALSIADIAKAAGVAVGSVYSHFKDKRALLPALLERRLDRIEARVDSFAQTGRMDDATPPTGQTSDLRTTVYGFVRAAREQVRCDRGLLRALLTHRRLYPELDAPRREALARRGLAAFESALQAHRDEIAQEDLQAAAKVAYYFVNMSYLDEAIFLTPPLPDVATPTDEEKLEAFSEMLYRYLKG